MKTVTFFTFVMFYSSFHEDDQIKAKHALQKHQLKVLCGSDEDVQRITIRRSNLLADAFRAFSKRKTNVSKRLKVMFVGEALVDEGGPHREFFELVLKEIFIKSGLFIGWPANVIPVCNTDAVAANKFFIIGRIIATCLVQGGQAPACFIKAVAEFLVYHEVRYEPHVDDITDVKVRAALMKVINHYAGYYITDLYRFKVLYVLRTCRKWC